MQSDMPVAFAVSLILSGWPKDRPHKLGSCPRVLHLHLWQNIAATEQTLKQVPSRLQTSVVPLWSPGQCVGRGNIFHLTLPQSTFAPSSSTAPTRRHPKRQLWTAILTLLGRSGKTSWGQTELRHWSWGARSCASWQHIWRLQIACSQELFVFSWWWRQTQHAPSPWR